MPRAWSFWFGQQHSTPASLKGRPKAATTKQSCTHWSRKIRQRRTWGLADLSWTPPPRSLPDQSPMPHPTQQSDLCLSLVSSVPAARSCAQSCCSAHRRCCSCNHNTYMQARKMSANAQRPSTDTTSAHCYHMLKQYAKDIPNHACMVCTLCAALGMDIYTLKDAKIHKLTHPQELLPLLS
jgi:hypothetical protein